MENTQKSTKFFCRDNSRLVFFIGFLAGIAFLVLIALIVYTVLALRQEEVNLSIQEQNQVAEEVQEELASGMNIKAINFSDQDQTKGNKKAENVLVVYMDFESAHSKQFYSPLNNFYQENSEQVRIVWRHFPLEFHAHARSAAIAAECAGEQDKFWEYADKLFEQQDQLSDSLYLEIVQELALDESKFNTCLENTEIDNRVSFHLEEGMAVGVSGTPNAVFLNQTDDTFKYIGGSVNESYLTSLLK